MTSVVVDKPASSPTIALLRKISESLDSEEHDLTEFFNCASDLFAIVDSDHKFIRLNRSWIKLLGWSSLKNVPWLYLVHHDDEKYVRSVIENLTELETLRFHCRLKCSDRKNIRVEFSVTKLAYGRFNLIGRVLSNECVGCSKVNYHLLGRSNACNTTDEQGTSE